MGITVKHESPFLLKLKAMLAAGAGEGEFKKWLRGIELRERGQEFAEEEALVGRGLRERQVGLAEEAQEFRKGESFWDRVFRDKMLERREGRAAPGTIAPGRPGAPRMGDAGKMLLAAQLKERQAQQQTVLNEQQEEVRYTNQQRRKLEEINDQMQAVNDALASGEITKQEADAYLGQLQAQKAGVKPLPLPKEEIPDIAEMLEKRTWVDPSNGVTWGMDNNNVPKVLREPPDKKPAAPKTVYDLEWKDRAKLLSDAQKFLEGKRGAEGQPISYEYKDVLALAEQWLSGKGPPPAAGAAGTPLSPEEQFPPTWGMGTPPGVAQKPLSPKEMIDKAPDQFKALKFDKQLEAAREYIIEPNDKRTGITGWVDVVVSNLLAGSFPPLDEYNRLTKYERDQLKRLVANLGLLKLETERLYGGGEKAKKQIEEFEQMRKQKSTQGYAEMFEQGPFAERLPGSVLDR